MSRTRNEIANLRREQIVDATVAIIAEQGLQNLSLSEIENRIDMSRGQLTYYFKTKEEILLAVFDRLLQMMCQQQGTEEEQKAAWLAMPWLEVVEHLLRLVMKQPPAHPEFHALQFTFLSQISHRDDFRLRLAELYERWRAGMTEHLENELDERRPVRRVSPRAMATLVQAMLHGLAMQRVADPSAVDPEEMVDLCLDVLETYLWAPITARGSKKNLRVPAQ